MTDRTLDELRQKLEEIRQSHINAATGTGSGALGAIVPFVLTEPIEGKQTVMAQCLTPCPPGATQLYRDVTGAWFAVSSAAASVRSVSVAQNRRRREIINPVRVRIAHLMEEATGEGLQGTVSSWAIVQGKCFKLLSRQRINDAFYFTDPLYLWTPYFGYLSATPDGSVYVDYRHYRVNGERLNVHFKISGDRVQQLNSSPSWRGNIVNGFTPYGEIENPTNTNPHPAYRFYATNGFTNIQNNQIWKPFFPGPYLQGGTTEPGFNTEIEFLTQNRTQGYVTIQPIRNWATGGDVQSLPFTTNRLDLDLQNGSAYAISASIAY